MRNMRHKKVCLMILCIISVVIMLVVTVYAMTETAKRGLSWFNDLERSSLVHHGAVPSGYKDCEEHYEDGFMDYTDYCKYFYTEKEDDLFSMDDRYQKVTKEDIEKIKGYFRHCGSFMEKQERASDFDFDYQSISAGDYVYINTKEGEKCGEDYVYETYDCYSVYLYDKESHILYYVHNN